MGFDRVSQRLVSEDFVLILAANFLATDKAGSFQVLDDSLHGSLGDADLMGYFAEDLFRLGTEQDQHMGMIGEKRPAMGLFGERLQANAGGWLGIRQLRLSSAFARLRAASNRLSRSGGLFS